ncbi:MULTISPECIES: carboxyl-terminal processing protease CtpC [unclassified Coleofasciculus]|uniref:carboxyl-terminal processing protease CtpC n=1 Tax=unclassified Coleofasciculus TaxID=2692782 RepID=UPI001880C22B|nr:MULTISPECIES: carboxyl-terminal processing protease CtpC [unclassified Coleofasciculus]MBE9128851.1 S41 family peptidase [Coleofasciculus sp. LEGE 07081]MBE9151525.1 S41 family peptidase [Coleofasciculus sp. LEGE 07092]
MVITKRSLVVGATAVVLTTVAVTGAGLHLSQSQAFFRESPKELVDEVWQIIDRNYVDATFNQVDWRAVRTDYTLNRSYTDKEEAYTAIREMLEKLEDPYTRFMDPEEFKNMQIDTSGELTGVGIQIAQDEETKKLMVIAPIEDTPAFNAGILAKDIILKIDGKSTEGMDVNDAVQLIRGQPGTSVILTIQRSEEEIDYEITRARIEIHPVRYSYRNSPTGGIGYIRLNQFSAIASQEMRDAIKELEQQGATGYILDLRSNPGGLLYSSIEIARMWLSEGTIVSTVNRQGEASREKANNRQLTDKPLVVLVDGGSASASEILSGALQDNKRAVLVGTTTFGKGLVQSVRGLGDGSGLAVTIAKYLTPSGRDINKLGIAPDFELELTEAQRKELQQNRTQIGTEGDPQYLKALDILKQEIASQENTRAASPVR